MKRLCLLLVAIPGVLQAQAVPRPASLLTTRGAFFGLSVADIQASKRWYMETLGLRVTMEQPRQNGVALAVLEGGGLIVELLQLDSAQPGPGDPERVHGLFKAGVIIENYSQALAALRARSVEVAYGPYPASQNQRANVIIRDNAGNLIQLFAN